MSDGGVEQGWYRTKDGRERYWDGDAWTDRYRDGDDEPPAPADRSPRDEKPEPAKEESKGSSPWMILAFAVAAIVVFACCNGVFSGDDDEPSSGSALTSCRNMVKAQIKNPSTADFAVLDTTITDTSISGEVTAENDFGAEKTLRYHCTISGDTVTDVTVNQL